MMCNSVLIAYVTHFSFATFVLLFQDCCKNLISSTVLLILTSFFNIDYISEGNSSVVTLAINITGIKNFTEICSAFESVFEVGKSGTLQLGTADITDVKTESLGTSIIFSYCKITQTKKQQNNKAYKICTTVRVSGCMCKCAYVSVC